MFSSSCFGREAVVYAVLRHWHMSVVVARLFTKNYVPRLLQGKSPSGVRLKSGSQMHFKLIRN